MSALGDVKRERVAVLGDGGWGTTLALLLYRKGIEVALWGAFPRYVDILKRLLLPTVHEAYLLPIKEHSPLDSEQYLH